VAAALAVAEGHEVVGVTLRLWDNQDTSGCCSVAEIDDARRVAGQIGIDHRVWSFTDDFETHVVAPYAEAHARGLTPNPCIECNRHLKFGRFLDRALQLGFDGVVTGHHARILESEDGRRRLLRGVDPGKDQSYVLYVLCQDQLVCCRFPVGDLTKAEVRVRAGELGLATAEKPDSQDACFVTSSGGRSALLGTRIGLHPGRVVDPAGAVLGAVEAVELVTVGQRRGLGIGASGGGERLYALAVDTVSATVVAGVRGDLLADAVAVGGLSWVGGGSVSGLVEAQVSAHGLAVVARLEPSAPTAESAQPFVNVVWSDRQRRVAPGQSVVFYRGAEVLGGGIALGGGPACSGSLSGAGSP